MADRSKITLPASEDETESRMRAALGLRGPGGPAPQQRADQARARHKFAQDGSVPVVVLNGRERGEGDSPLKTRITELEHALEAERQSHNATRRALLDAQTAAQGLQTRLAHAELAHQDALAASQQALDAALEAARAAAPAPRKVVRKAPIERLPREREPKPVKWWTPTYRAKSKAK